MAEQEDSGGGRAGGAPDRPGEIARLRAVFDLVGDAVFILDAEGRFVDVNRTACERYGYTRDEMLRLHILDLDTPEQKKFAAGRIRKGLDEGGAVFEAVHQAKDGRAVPVEVNTRVVSMSGGRYFISVCRDTTDRKQAEEALRRSQEHLRIAERYEAVGRLAGGVAHNINNLMMVVAGYADSLLKSLPPRDPLRAAVERIRAAGGRAAGIASRLLFYSRQQLIVPKLAELGAYLAGMGETLAAVAGERARVSLEPGPEELVVEVDVDQLRHVFEELVANAREASGPGGGNVAIRWRRERVAAGAKTSTGVKVPQGEYALVEVADDGCGMEESMLPHIFEPFVTTREFGRGLGLPSIYGFVKQSDGFISIRSAPGKGTTVSLYFPLARPVPGAR